MEDPKDDFQNIPPTPVSTGEWVVLADRLKRLEALRIAERLQYRLPNTPGRWVHVQCSATGVERVVATQDYVLGRVSHLRCCGRGRVGKGESKALPIPAQAHMSIWQALDGQPQRRIWGGTYKTLLQGFASASPDDAWRTVIRVRHNDLDEHHDVPPQAVRAYRWLAHLPRDLTSPFPLEDPQGPQHALETLKPALKTIQALLTSLGLEHEQAATSTRPAPYMPPTIVPTLQWDEQEPLALDWSTDPPTTLTEEQSAALAILAWAWAEKGQDSPTRAFVRGMFLVPPERIPRLGLAPWFREVPPDPSPDPNPTEAKTPLGRTVASVDFDRLILCRRPPDLMELPINFMRPVKEWSFAFTEHYEMAWPAHFSKLPS